MNKYMGLTSALSRRIVSFEIEDNMPYVDHLHKSGNENVLAKQEVQHE